MNIFGKRPGVPRPVFFACLLASGLAFHGCSDSDDPVPGPPDPPAGGDPELTVTADLAFGPEGGSLTLTVTSDCAWSVSTEAGWLTLSADGGEGNAEIVVAAAENLSSSGRRAALTVSSGTLSRLVEAVQAALEAKPLDAGGSANSYIVPSGGGVYSFTAAYRGGSESDALGEWDSASLVWQDAPALVTAVRCLPAEKRVLVTVGDGSGNAVVAVSGADGIVWSWHLWVSGYDPAATAFVTPSDYGGGSVWRFMDRNLGALTAEPGSLDALGLIYQWGRKDPFTSSGGWTETERPLYDIEGDPLPGFEQRARPNGTIALSVANPDVFYTVSYPTGDWHDASDDDMWGGVSGVKSIYDPCPPGWKVPASDAAGATPYGFLTHDNSPWSSENRGRLYEAGDWWLPAAGTRVNETGGLSIDVGDGYGGIWFGTHGKASENLDEFPALYGQYMFVISGKRTFKVSKDTRAQGMSVRCVAE